MTAVHPDMLIKVALRFSRAAIFPLLLAFILLFAQQAGAVHTLHHALAGQSQHDKQAPHSDACEQCADYAQMGNALGVAAYDFTSPAMSAETIRHKRVAFRSLRILAAAARGPPKALQTIA